MLIDADVRALLDEAAALDEPDFEIASAAEVRALFAARPSWAGAPVAVARIDDRIVPGPHGDIQVRVYTPHAHGAAAGLVYFHGGGWVHGDLEMVDVPCRALCRHGGCVVISVDYRLAPEHKFPVPLEDCYAATRYVAEHSTEFDVDPGRLAVGGDSAGGNLAAAVALLARDRSRPSIAFQLLVYPITDYSFDTPSYRNYPDGFLLTRKAMAWYWNQYLGGRENGWHPHASPLRIRDLRELPPGLVMTAEFDPLRDEGEAYAARLRESGVAMETRRLDGMVHGFFRMGGRVEAARQAVEYAAAALRTALAR